MDRKITTQEQRILFAAYKVAGYEPQIVEALVDATYRRGEVDAPALTGNLSLAAKALDDLFAACRIDVS